MLKKFMKYVSQNMLGMVGMSVYILADTYFISVAVGADGITALNLVLPIYNIIFAIGAMMGVGSAIRFVVERNKKSPDADGYFFHALVWAFIISLFFIFVGLFLPDKLIALLGGDAQIVATGKNYTRIFMCFAPFFMWNYICNAFVRNDGNPSIAMSATLFSSLFNIVFDYILMFPLGLSMEGASLATALSPVIGIAICSIHFQSKKSTIRLKPVLPSFRRLLYCCQVGVSSFVGEISSGVITVVFNMLILGLAGNTGVAAYGVVANTSLVAVALFNGIAQGSQPLISEAYSKGNQVLASYAENGLRLYFIGFLFAGMNIIGTSILSSIESAKYAFFASISRGFVAIIIFAFVLSALLGLNGVWLAFPAAEFVTMLITLYGLVKAIRKCNYSEPRQFS